MFAQLRHVVTKNRWRFFVVEITATRSLCQCRIKISVSNQCDVNLHCIAFGHVCLGPTCVDRRKKLLEVIIIIFFVCEVIQCFSVTFGSRYFPVNSTVTALHKRKWPWKQDSFNFSSKLDDWWSILKCFPYRFNYFYYHQFFGFCVLPCISYLQWLNTATLCTNCSVTFRCSPIRLSLNSRRRSDWLVSARQTASLNNWPP